MFIQYMKNFKRVIIVSIIMLLMAVALIALIAHRNSQPEEREFSGVFVRSVYNCNGHLYQAQEKSNVI